MPIDTDVPLSPGWWLHRLAKRLVESRDDYDTLESYYQGNQPVPTTASKAVRLAYQRLMSMSKTNYAELVTEAVGERLRPIAFRTGADGDIGGDSLAWRLWQANRLDAEAPILIRTALSMRDAYAIVGGPDPETGLPVVSTEDPRQVVAEYDPVRRGRPVAALKLFRSDAMGADLAYLYLPGFVMVARRPLDAQQGPNPVVFDLTGWEWSRGPQALPARVVPVVGFHNRIGISRTSMSEFEPHIPILDRINYQILNRLEIITMQAFKQRAVKGVPMRDENGQQIDYSDIFSADPGAMWNLPDTAEIWESREVDITPIHTTIRADVQDLAAASRTPLFYLTPDAANGSAEGASLAREGLVFKCENRQLSFGESFEQVMSLQFLFAGDQTRASLVDLETVWAPVERFSLAEKYDAASKAAAAGVPWRSIMADILGFTPQQIERMETERLGDALLAPEPVAPVETVEQQPAALTTGG